MFTPGTIGPVIRPDNIERSRVHENRNHKKPCGPAVIRISMSNDDARKPTVLPGSITGQHCHYIGMVDTIAGIYHDLVVTRPDKKYIAAAGKLETEKGALFC
jgi:hypothetical protein